MIFVAYPSFFIYNNLQVISMENNKLVVKANDLIQKSRFSLTLQQQRIILYLISQIKMEDENFKLYEFSISDFCRACGITISGNGYLELKDSIKALADKSLWVELENGTETLLRWIEKPYIDKSKGIIKIKLDADMRPFLLQLKEHFTAYELIYTLYFKSKYSIRLYELIKSIHYNETKSYERIYSVDELKTLIGATIYNKFNEFHARVLKPAVNEINKFSDKNVEYSFIKNGRFIAKIKLVISTKNPIERLAIKDKIEKDLKYNKPSLYDEISDKGLI